MDQISQEKTEIDNPEPVASLEGDSTNASTTQVVVFSLDKEEYAIPISDVKEIIKIADVTPVPNSPNFVKGIVNLRGDIVVVVDLEVKFNLQREHESLVGQQHIVIVENEGSVFGLLVDKVIEVRKVLDSNIKETPSLVSSKIKIDYLKGVTVLGAEQKDGDETVENNSRLLIILDVSRMLNEKELTEVQGAVHEAPLVE